MKYATNVLGLVAAVFCGTTLAQHETGSDVESGARAYQTSCATCHGPDGNLIAGIDFSRGVFRRPLSDNELVTIILNGIPNTPMPPNAGMSEAQASEIVAYLRSLPDTLAGSDAVGDISRGRQAVTGAGECLDCHAIGRAGSHLGPDLSLIGRDRRAIRAEHRFVRVVPRRGAAVVGRLLNQDSFSVQLLDEDERLRSFDKSALREVGFVESPMPSYRDRFSQQEIADVVAYLASLRGEATQ